MHRTRAVVVVAAGVLAFTALLGVASPASAHGKTFVGLSFGFGYSAWPHYRHYHRHYYHPPAVVYVPPPVVHVPPPVVYTQPAPIVATPISPAYVARNGQTCREYQTTALVAGVSRPIYGTACLQPDGAWRIVN